MLHAFCGSDASAQRSAHIANAFVGSCLAVMSRTTVLHCTTVPICTIPMSLGSSVNLPTRTAGGGATPHPAQQLHSARCGNGSDSSVQVRKRSSVRRSTSEPPPVTRGVGDPHLCPSHPVACPSLTTVAARSYQTYKLLLVAANHAEYKKSNAVDENSRQQGTGSRAEQREELSAVNCMEARKGRRAGWPEKEMWGRSIPTARSGLVGRVRSSRLD